MVYVAEDSCIFMSIWTAHNVTLWVTKRKVYNVGMGGEEEGGSGQSYEEEWG